MLDNFLKPNEIYEQHKILLIWTSLAHDDDFLPKKPVSKKSLQDGYQY